MRARSAATILFAFVLTPLTALAQPAPEPKPEPKPEAKPEPKGEPWEHEPARAADPPILPAPGSGPPLSTSGTDVGTPSRAPSGPVVVEDAGAAGRTEARLRLLEARVAAGERRMRRMDEKLRLWKHVTISAFVQPQLLVQSFNAAASPNAQNGSLPSGIGANDVIAQPDGSTTNTTAFRLRRTRLRTGYEANPMRLWIQIDVFPVGGIGSGIGTIVRNAEATGIARWTRDVRTELTAGMFLIPFRAELLEQANVRPWIERTWYVQNVFPAERDLGVHAKTLALHDRLVVDFSIVNGQPLGAPYFVQTPDLNKSKDFMAYLTYRAGPVTLGASGYLGRGEIVDAQLLRFKQFTKWAVNYQALARARLIRLGETRLSSELVISRNMDTGIRYPFARPAVRPVLSDDVESRDERAFYVRFEQDLARWLTAGYRFDTYTPDTSLDENARDTHGFLAMVTLSQHLRWMNELDWAIDNVHPSGAEPPSRHIVSFSTVLQAGF